MHTEGSHGKAGRGSTDDDQLLVVRKQHARANNERSRRLHGHEKPADRYKLFNGGDNDDIVLLTDIP